MPFKTLNIDFGGLCLFVQSTVGPVGLYVLMPKMDNGDKAMLHCPMMLVPNGNLEPGAKHGRLVPLVTDNDKDLTDLANTSGRAPFPWGALQISDIVGEYVDTTYLVNPIAGNLNTRVILPFGTEMRPAGGVGKVLVPGESEPVTVVGRVTVTVALKDPSTILTIGGQQLYPDSAGVVSIQLVNVPRAHVDRRKRPHKVGDPATHIRGYYGLMENYDEDGDQWPNVVIAETINGDPKATAPMPCAKKSEDFDIPSAGPASIYYVDPLICTAGTATARV